MSNPTCKPGRPRLHIGGGVQERLYLPLDVHEWLKREAERLNIPKSQIVTEMVRQKILKESPDPMKLGAREPVPGV